MVRGKVGDGVAMAEFEIVLRRDRRSVRLVLTGAFDLAGAAQVAEALESTPSAPITLDFTRVTALPDAALGPLAEAIQLHRERLLLRGLRQHHLRLLQYLRLEVDEEGRLILLDPAGPHA